MSQQKVGQKGLSDGHKEILRDFTFNKSLSECNYNLGKARRMVSQKVFPGGIKIPLNVDEKVSKNGILIHPELLEFIFQLDGIPKKLLLYLMFYCVKSRTNKFLFNTLVVSDFNKYSLVVTEKVYSKSNVLQGLRRLVKLNIIQNVKKGSYMLNPLIGTGSWNNRRILISEYSTLLHNKGKDPMIDFYPKKIEKKPK
jgi:hypothetical protein